MARKEYAGGAPSTTLAGSISSGVLTLTLASGTGYPAGTNPFVIVVDPGLSTEEKILCDSRSGDTVTINASGRGYDDTTAAAHADGAAVQHVLDADTVDEANAHVNDDTRDDHSQYLNTTRHNVLDHSTALGTAALNDLADVAGAPSTGDVLTYDGSWGPVAPSVPVVAIDSDTGGTNTSSTTYVTATTAVAIDVPDSGDVIVWIGAVIATGAGQTGTITAAMSGANTQSAADADTAGFAASLGMDSDHPVNSDTTGSVGTFWYYTGLTPGSTTWTLNMKSSVAANLTVTRRRVLAMGLP